MSSIEHGCSIDGNLSHTGDSTWTTKSTVSAGSFVAGGKYLIVCTAQVGGDDYNDTFGFRLVHGSTPTVFLGAEMIIEVPQPGTSNFSRDYGYVTVFDQPGGGAEALAFQLWTNDTANTAYVNSLVIWWMRLDVDLVADDDWVFNEDDDTSAPVEPSVFGGFSSFAEISSVGASGETWLVLSCMDYRGATGGEAYWRLRRVVGGEYAPMTVQEGEDTVEHLTWLLARAYTLTQAEGFQLQGAEEAENNNVLHYSSRIFALRLDAFADFETFWNEAEVTVPDATPTEIANLLFTPSAQANFLLMHYSSWDYYDYSNCGVPVIRVNGTGVPSTRSGDEMGMNDGTDEVASTTIYQSNLSATEQDLDVLASSTSGYSAYFEDRFFLALSMELAAAGPKMLEADLSASGTLTATLTRIRSLVAALSGSGTLTPYLTRIRSLEAALDGEGTLSAVVTRVRALEAALSGEGTLDANIIRQRLLEASLSGEGTLSAAITRLRYLEAALSGEGTLAADITLLGAVRWLEAALSGESSLDASLTRIRPLVASLSGSGTLSASLTRIRYLEAALAGEGLLEAVLSEVPEGLEAALSAEGLLAANLSVIRRLEAALVGESDLSATISRVRYLSAVLTGSGTLTADLTIGGVKNLVAALSAEGTLTANLTRIAALGASLAGSGTLSASIIRQRYLAAALSADGTLSAELARTRPLVASLSGEGILAASLSAIRPLSASLEGSGTLAANIRRLRLLSAALSGEGILTSRLTALHALQAALQGTGYLQAYLSRSTHLVAALTGESNLSAILTYVAYWLAWGVVTRSINPGDFPVGTEFRLEVHLSTSNAAYAAYARLYNITDGSTVVELSTNETEAARILSEPLSLPSGDKLYRIDRGGLIGATYTLHDAVLRWEP